MAELIISPDDATFATLQNLAEHEAITPEELAARLLKESIHQIKKDWAAARPFGGEKRDTSASAENVPVSGWNPT